jgi:hypothetical protein
MTYNPNIPQGIDLPSASQPQLLTNFNQANTLFALNHYTFNDATVALRGKHKIVVMPVAAAPATTATEAALYTKAYPVTLKPTLYFRQNNSGSEIQMSGPTPIFTQFVYNGKPALRANTFLPGGLLFQYGYFYYDAGTTPSVLYASSFSGGFAAYSIQLTIERDHGSAVTLFVKEGTSTDSEFKMTSDVSGDHFVYWTAIGPS